MTLHTLKLYFLYACYKIDDIRNKDLSFISAKLGGGKIVDARGTQPPLYFWRDQNGRIEVDCLIRSMISINSYRNQIKHDHA